ncbi:DJ-1/PfpI family protein [Nocardioides sp. ChNu-153]|uniref:DJ-1/PfpI family protein n=1 Tax=unclassified Nocardioides TaxID=2615069 RepID=UPI002406A382|nr:MULTISPECIES: DJ-1/PfpI family protein [unclassified Nocardioides]MDN7120464.1 DJ-1/PfpI family protein [Nocardioides sp. ChNu-153]
MIGILVFDDVEVLDACGPYEVFTTAARVAARRGDVREEAPPFEVLLVAADASRPVRARAGLRLGVDVALADAPALDLLLVPGGVTDAVEADAEVVAWVRERAAATPLVASVCTGAFVLAEAGVLVDQTVTTHWEDVPDLRRRWPALDVVEDRRWVRDGDVLTSAGISAGIDLALHLVEVLAGRALAEATARQMDYAWQETAAG